MAAWRKKALKEFPQIRKEINNRKFTIYFLFYELLDKLEEAHRSNDSKTLKKIYEFAKWCLNQKSQHIWNAAGVVFYEGLVKSETTRKAIPYRIKPEIFKQVKGLFEIGLGNKRLYKKLLATYNKINKSNFEIEKLH